MIGIFLDIESNGLDPRRHRILEIAFKCVHLEDKKILKVFDHTIYQPPSIWEQSDPKSLKVNGFKPSPSHGDLTEKEAASKIISYFDALNIHRDKAVYICQNPSFDRSFFSQLIDPSFQEKKLWPYHWLDLASMFWAFQEAEHLKKQQKAPWEIGISKNKIARFLGLQEEKAPHRALQGVEHLIACYFALLEHFI